MIVSEKELSQYESTGRAMKKPKPRVAGPVTVTKAATKPTTTSYRPEAVATKKLYVHVLDPDDNAKLMALREICAKHPGVSDIVLVLGADKKSAIKLPFKIDESDALISELVKQLGEDAVKLK